MNLPILQRRELRPGREEKLFRDEFEERKPSKEEAPCCWGPFPEGEVQRSLNGSHHFLGATYTSKNEAGGQGRLELRGNRRLAPLQTRPPAYSHPATHMHTQAIGL